MSVRWKIGDKIQGRWEIYEILQGPISMVYLVHNQELNKPFAVKTLREEIFTYSPDIAECFVQEALAWVCLNVHQNVTKAHLVQKIGGIPFLFLEYIGGGDLNGWIGTPRLMEDLPQILRFAMQFCNGMTHALSNGVIVHGDIKPQNCLITEDNTLKITDFGLVKVLDRIRKSNGEVEKVGEREKKLGKLLGRLFGKLPTIGEKEVEISPLQDPNKDLSRIGLEIETLTYMAPEQFDDITHRDVRTDIYSFGVMLFQMITGRPPFVGQTWQELEHLHKTQSPPPLGQQPSGLHKIVETCLAKDPAHRFPDFRTVWEYLTEIYERLVKKLVTPPLPEMTVSQEPALMDQEVKPMGGKEQDEEQILMAEETRKEAAEPISVIRITYFYQGKEEEKIFHDDVVIGRAMEGLVPDLDLTSDRFVSRLHARIWMEEGAWWIEDLDSNNGTRVNGEEIKGKGKWRLQRGNHVIRVGKTRLQVQVTDLHALRSDGISALQDLEPPPEIIEVLEAHKPLLPIEAVVEDAAKWLTFFYELPLRFAEEVRLTVLLQEIVERTMEIVPKSKCGALLFRDPSTGQLLKAYLSAGEPVVNTAMAQQALENRKAFIWCRKESSQRSSKDPVETSLFSVSPLSVESGMCAPLLWKDRPLGVLCVDNHKVGSAFDRNDLQRILIISHYAAMAVANYKRQDELQRHVTLVKKLFPNFPPGVREKLVEKAYRGRLRPGGKKARVTLLYLHICGFASLSTSRNAKEVLDLLNYYLTTLVKIIFKYDGTIGQYRDGGILAVFGSPEPDPQQKEKALQAAMEIQVILTKLNAIRTLRSQISCEVGIGIHCGEIICGFVGSDTWIEFVVVGPAIHQVLQYGEGANAGEIVVSPEIYELIQGKVQAEEIALSTPKGEKLIAYRIKDRKIN